jgi:enoyl-CoA hydratase/carnithine racemase
LTKCHEGDIRKASSLEHCDEVLPSEMLAQDAWWYPFRVSTIQTAPIRQQEVREVMIDVEYSDKVAVVRLNRGTTNPLNLEFVGELAAMLREVRTDAQARGIVLRSTNEKFLSIGFDVPQLYGLSEGDFQLFYDAFNDMCFDLYTMPKPTVAAITGHAIAGGCILALCCDYRLIAAGRRLMGLNEVKLGVPVPYLVDCVLRDLAGVRHAREILEMGEFYRPEELLRLGMVDEVFPLKDVVAKAIAKAEQLGAMPPLAYEVIKRNRVERVAGEVQARWEERRREFVKCWYSEEARERLRAAMESF